MKKFWNVLLSFESQQLETRLKRYRAEERFSDMFEPHTETLCFNPILHIGKPDFVLKLEQNVVMTCVQLKCELYKAHFLTKRKPAAPGVPKRSPIQVLSGPNVA